MAATRRELPDYADVTKTKVSRNIISEPDKDIGKWSGSEIKRAITHGIRPDGTRLAPTMPSEWYKGIAPADLDAIVAYLRTLKPLKHHSPTRRSDPGSVTGMILGRNVLYLLSL